MKKLNYVFSSNMTLSWRNHHLSALY